MILYMFSRNCIEEWDVCHFKDNITLNLLCRYIKLTYTYVFPTTQVKEVHSATTESTSFIFSLAMTFLIKSYIYILTKNETPPQLSFKRAAVVSVKADSVL